MGCGMDMLSVANSPGLCRACQGTVPGMGGELGVGWATAALSFQGRRPGVRSGTLGSSGLGLCSVKGLKHTTPAPCSWLVVSTSGRTAQELHSGYLQVP